MAISVVQTKVILDASSGSFSSPVGAGNTVIACIFTWNTSNVTITTTGVTLGGSGAGFAEAVSDQAYGGDQTTYAGIWYGPTGAGGQSAVAATVTNGNFGAGDGTGLILYEVSGLVTGGADQKASAAAASGTAVSSGTTGTTSQSSEIAFGAAFGDSTLSSPSPGYTNTNLGGSFVYSAAGYLILAAQGTTSYSATQSATGSWAAVVVTLRAAGAAPSSAAATGTVTASGGHKAVTGSLSLGGSGEVTPHGTSSLPQILQQVPGNTTYDYGWSTTNLTTTEGSTLICFAGWDLNATGATSALMPAAYVVDSAGNYWVHAGTSSASLTGARASVWVCCNAMAVEWISCSLTTFASSLAYLIVEIASGPALAAIDIAAPNSSASATSLTVDAGTSTAFDYAFTMLAAGNATSAISSGPGGLWTALDTVTSGSGSPNSVAIFPYWSQDVPQGTDVTATYGISGAAAPLAGVTVALVAAPEPPEQLNENFPVLAVQAGFGFDPGDPSQTPPTWTDITDYVMAPGGSAFISTTAGRQYELASPEAGEMTVMVNNLASVFTPGNADSPFYPDVVLGVPLHVAAWWQGRWYHTGYGYVERWPQQWPDLPQWGISSVVATDAYSVLNAATMTEALPGDMLLDAPYVLLTGAEQYTSLQNGLNVTYAASECQGLLAANISRVNQRAGMYVDGTAAPMATGGTSNLLGDSQTGFGTTSISSAPTISSSGPGLIYTDPAMPDPVSANGVTVEFWLTITDEVASADLQPTVFQAYGPASSYQTVNPQLLVQVLDETGNANLLITFADASTFSVVFSVSQYTQQVALEFTSSSLAVYVNGGLAGTTTLTAAQVGSWQSFSAGCSNYAYQARSTVAGNYTMQCVALYPYQVSQQRLVSHYATGNGGQEGVDASQRIAQILAWTYLGLPRGGRVYFNGVTDGVEQGPAYQLGGQSAASAVNQVVTNDQAAAFVAPSGALVYVPRWGIYDIAPAATFGDATDGTEIPYQQAQSFGYDNTYLYNTDAITRQVGPNQSITATSTSFPSSTAYFLRSALTQTIQTTSDLDAYDIANWDIAKYAQPEYRISTITIDASSNPTQAFPTVLALQQAQVVTVNRRPVGGAEISVQAIVQKISHQIGPTLWQTAMEISPYSLEAAVLEADTPGYNVVGNNTLG